MCYNGHIMGKMYITIIFLGLLLAGAIFFIGQKNKVEMPTINNNVEQGNTDNINSGKTLASEKTPIDGAGVKNSVDVSAGMAEAVKEFTVTALNFSFTPNVMTVKKGDRVKITFRNSQGFHDFKIDEFGVATQQSKSPHEEVLEFTADKVGSFQYYCSVGSHRAMGMWGTLKVE